MGQNASSQQVVNTSIEIHPSNQQPQEEMIINQIITSQPQCKKIVKLKDIQQQLVNITDEELMKIFNFKTFKVIQEQMNDISSEIFHDLLNLIEFILERGSQMQIIRDYQTFTYKTPLFDEMKLSGLISKLEMIIEKIFNIKLEQNNNNKVKFSKQQKKMKEKQINNDNLKEKIIGQLQPNIQEQVVRVYFLIMIGQKIDIKILKKFTEIINNNNNMIINLLKNDINELEMKDKDNLINEFKKKIQSFEKTIKLLIKTNLYNRDNQYIIIYQTDFVKYLLQMIHINCPIQLNCNLNISIKVTPQLQTFHELAYNIIGQLSNYQGEFQQFLFEQEDILLHIQFIISNYNKSHSIQQQIKEEQQLQFQSPILMKHVSYLLYQLLECNQQNVIEVSQIPNFIQQLVNLNQNKLLQQMNEDEDLKYNNLNDNNLSLVIRENCQKCLNCIVEYANESSVIQLSNSGYSKSLIEQLSSYNSQNNGNDNLINISLQSIINFFLLIIFGKENKSEPEYIDDPIDIIDDLSDDIENELNQKPQFSKQPICVKNSIEQLEKTGGFEEIELQLINNQNDQQGRVNPHAYLAKLIISNCYQGQDDNE